MVTTVEDTFDHNDNDESLSIREAIALANDTDNVTEEIWIPAWQFTLTRDRATYGVGSTDTDIAFGDLDISDSLVIRGIEGQTKVDWKAGVVDEIFDLLGDFNGDGQTDDGLVGLADFSIWQAQNGSTGAWEEFSADGDDDGDVDADDYAIWVQHYGNTLDLFDLVAGS